MGFKKSYYLGFLTLLSIIFVTWLIFYNYISGLIKENRQEQLENTANQIMDNMGDDLDEIERLVFLLSHNSAIKQFITERDIDAYFQEAKYIDELLSGNMIKTKLANHVIVFNQDGAFYRFNGSLGNTTCKHIYNLVSKSEMLEHLVVDTQEGRLVGYGKEINNDHGERIGAVAILMEEAMILSQLQSYDQSDTLHISIASDNEIIISDTSQFIQSDLQKVENEAYFSTRRAIGITPFSILITADLGYLRNLNRFFSVSAVITLTVLGFTLFSFLMLTNRNFLSPLQTIMQDVENLDLYESHGSLSYTEFTHFNRLITKINALLQRIEAKNESIQKGQLLIKNAEIKNQKAINVALKKQINAHFTVNSLNIIKILISKRNNQSAMDMCNGLSLLVRYAHDEDLLINALEEFHVLENYVTMMNIRYENKFTVYYNIDDRLIDYRIPRMLIQPIIENSMLHGYKEKQSECRIEITANANKEMIYITIEDNGCGLSVDQLESLKEKMKTIEDDPMISQGIESIALVNINKRIAYYYGQGYGVSFELMKPHGLKTTIKLGFCPII